MSICILQPRFKSLRLSTAVKYLRTLTLTVRYYVSIPSNDKFGLYEVKVGPKFD